MLSVSAKNIFVLNQLRCFNKNSVKFLIKNYKIYAEYTSTDKNHNI